MRIFVRAKTLAKENKVEKISGDLNLFNSNSENDESRLSFVVSVKESPTQGKANEAIIKALADYFKVSKFDVKIISGRTSKKKIIEIGKR